MLDNNQLIYGGSVAAALATGLAARLLLISRLVHRSAGSNQGLTPIKIVEVFQKLSKDTKFVFLEELDNTRKDVFLVFEKLFSSWSLGE